jgi:hypothetical protein
VTSTNNFRNKFEKLKISRHSKNGHFSKSRHFLFLVLFLILALNFSQIAEATVTVQVEILDVAPNGKPKELEVSPGRSGATTYGGNVYVIRTPPSSGKVLVTFDPVDTEGGVGWGGTVMPSSLDFQVAPAAANNRIVEQLGINVTVKAPPYELMSNKRNITITGKWILNPGVMEGEVVPYSFPIALKHYYWFFVRPIEADKKVWPSQPAEFELEIRNFGNAEDVYMVEVNPDDRAVLEKYGFVVEFKQSTIKVPARESRSFTFTVHGPQRNFHLWKNQQNMIPIRVSTLEAPPGEEMSVIYYVAYYEVGTFIPDPCLILLAVAIITLIILIILYKKGKLKRRKWKRKKE